MKRTVAVLSALVVLTPVAGHAATRPKPVPVVQLSGVVESCQYGYAWVSVNLKANAAGTYDIWQAGDNAFDTFVAESDTLAAGETLVTSLSLPYPEQTDVVVTRTGDPISRPLASKSVAAAPCTNGWS